MEEYPKRSAYFANKFVRLLLESRAATEIGHGAFCLLVAVAQTEDALRYRCPVSFWNQSLMDMLGFTRWHTFDAARQKAIDAGWLVYVNRGKRQVGLYWVTVPSHLQVALDSPALESLSTPSVDKTVHKTVDSSVHKAVHRTVHKAVEPSILYPNPVPFPFPEKVVVVVGGSDEPDGEVTPKWVKVLREKASEVAKPKAAMDYVERIAKSVALGLTPRQSAAPLAATIRKGNVQDLTAYLSKVVNSFEEKYDPQILTREIE